MSVVALTSAPLHAGDDTPLPAEAGLVRRVQAGDLAAFDELVRTHLPRALRVARRVVATAEDAEDVVQEAFMAALRAIASFDVGRPFAPWLGRIVLNRAISWRRTRGRKGEEALAPDVPAAGPSPADAAERAEVLERFRTALATLPQRQRTIVQLFEVDGYSSPEIAEMLGLSDGTVRWHIHTARRTLRAALAPWAPGGDDDDAR